VVVIFRIVIQFTEPSRCISAADLSKESSMSDVDEDAVWDEEGEEEHQQGAEDEKVEVAN